MLGGVEAGYRVHRSADGFTGRDGPRLALRFGLRGVLVRAGRSDLRMRLVAVGVMSSVRRLAVVAPYAHDNRVTYGHGPVREWYANGPLGLEQGSRCLVR